jgi:hypothetical protein
MVTTDKDFGTIDLNTGDFTSAGFDQVQIAGLGEIGSSSLLYGASYGSGVGTLYSIDTTNGSLTTVGTDTAVAYLAFGSTLTSLYALEGTSGGFDLYSIDPTTGQATLVGDTGIAQGGDFTLSTNSTTLYFTESDELYTLNTTTGAPTLVGSTGGPQFGALVTEGGTLYGGEYNPNYVVDTLNTINGTATVGPALSGTSSGFGGLAAIPAIVPTPEPGNVSMLLLVLLTGGLWVKTRLAKRQTAADPD